MWKPRKTWLMLVLSVAGILSCSRKQAPPDANTPPLASSISAFTSSTSSTSSTSDSSASQVSATGSAGGTNPSPRATDERWQKAQGEDLADKQALADALGATGLLEALDDGGNTTLIALLCLPLADDADIALGPLAQRLRDVSNDLREPYLSAILAIAGRPARAREAVDPEGATQAGEVLVSIAKNDALPREQRVLAVSAARALAEKKVVDPAKIPTDLDPP